MARNKDGKIELTAYDELFMTDEQRAEEKLAKIRDIPLDQIDDFPEHPYKVRLDEDMDNLVESIKERGVITPATVRQKEDGRYEMISGHRRKKASELAGLDNLRCEVVDISRDEAIILMVESNFQRSEILPSEKAHAYKMRNDAIKRKAGRTVNGDPVGPNLRTSEILSQESGDSASQIKRYLRLNELVPELLEFVDEGKIKMRPAVEMSYLDEDSQRDIVDCIDLMDCTPSHDQTIRMRKAMDAGRLTTEVIQSIMSEEKPNQRERIVLQADKVKKFIPRDLAKSKTEEYILNALESYWKQMLKKREEREER